MKKVWLQTFLAGIILSGLFFIGGCDDDSYDIPEYTEFQVQVDSIEYPSSIFLGQNLTIKFYATLGPDGCYTFSRFDATLTDNLIDVTVYGKHEQRDICTDAISYLYGSALDVSRLDTGMYIIHVNQPYPPDIYDTVYVKRITVSK